MTNNVWIVMSTDNADDLLFLDGIVSTLAEAKLLVRREVLSAASRAFQFEYEIDPAGVFFDEETLQFTNSDGVLILNCVTCEFLADRATFGCFKNEFYATWGIEQVACGTSEARRAICEQNVQKSMRYKAGTYTSVWDEGTVDTPCKVDTFTQQVVEIKSVDAPDMEHLVREYITFEDEGHKIEHPVVLEGEALPINGYWR